MARKKKAPYLEPPTRPIFQTLPPELLHLIFSALGLRDVKALRTTCSVFAAVGVDYLTDEVPLVFHRDNFKALTEIAKHPRLSKHLRSLFYVFDRCRLVNYETWDIQRPDPRPWEEEGWDMTARTYTNRDIRTFERASNKRWSQELQRRASVPQSERRAGYEAFTALCRDQRELEDEFYDRQCLRALFVGCKKIDEVTVASRKDMYRDLAVVRTAFKDAMTEPREDRQWWRSGIDQVLCVAIAACQAATLLDSLTLSGVSPLLFDRKNRIENEVFELKLLMEPLWRLRLFLNVEPPGQGVEIDEEDPGIEQVQRETDTIFREGHLHELLSAARQLRVLKLQLPSWWDFSNDVPSYSAIEECLRDTKWYHLYELSLSNCKVRAQYLLDLCLRHKWTLRRLSLYNIQLLDRDWDHVFTGLSGQLPELRQAKLRGDFSIGHEVILSFECAGEESDRTAPYRDAWENYVVKGGTWPSPDLPHRGDYPNASYEPSGRPDNERPDDDPARIYMEDEFDWRI